MPRYIFLLFFITGISSGLCDDDTSISPQHTFEVVQTNGKEGKKETLHFFKYPEKDVVLEEAIPWAGNYYISPDEKWVIRIQKSGSGDNISYLYKIGPDQSVWRLERQIGEHALALLSRRPGGLPAGLYHTGIEFGTWDLKASRFHFAVFGTGENGAPIFEALIYDLSNNTIAPDPHPPTTR